MSSAFLIVASAVVVVLTVVLLWAFLSGARRKLQRPRGLEILGNAPRHLCAMTAIRQSQDAEDLRFVREKGSGELARRVRRERRQVALLYLDALHRDFEALLRIASIAALLSAEISAPDEYERLRLSLMFRARFRLLKLRYLLGDTALPGLGALGQMVSSLAVEMERAMEQLGERAALAAELAWQPERRA